MRMIVTAGLNEKQSLRPDENDQRVIASCSVREQRAA
jgi:hypothetical protein